MGERGEGEKWGSERGGERWGRGGRERTGGEARSGSSLDSTRAAGVGGAGGRRGLARLDGRDNGPFQAPPSWPTMPSRLYRPSIDAT